jgi:hypothetical protein
MALQRLVATTTGLLLTVGLSAGWAARLPSKQGPSLPDPALTSGATNQNVTQENISETICVPGYTKTVPKVSATTKASVYASYKISNENRSKYVIDNLIPISLGGGNAVENLWAQVKNGGKGAQAKDKIENKLASWVCNGTTTLADAQTAIATDWTRVKTSATTTPTTTPAPPTTFSHRSAVQDWAAKYSPIIRALGMALSERRDAVSSGDISRARVACQHLHDADVALQDDLPTPDAELTNALQSAVDDYGRSANFCIRGTTNLSMSDLDQASSFVDQATVQMQTAAVILSGFGVGTD